MSATINVRVDVALLRRLNKLAKSRGTEGASWTLSDAARVAMLRGLEAIESEVK